MPITIGSNIGSLRLLRRLDSSTNELGRAYERLSSGLRISRASDDPAGLAVSSDLIAKSRILNRARQNLNDAFSVLSVADGTLESLTNLTIRMSELAEQAANGAMTNAQRASLSAEYEQLDREIRRLSQTTTFNGLNLLEGSKSTNAGAMLISDGAGASSLAISADGRFRGFVSGSINVKLYDTLTNSVRTIADPGGGGVQDVRLLANGDAIIQAYNGASSSVDLYYYDYSTNQSRKLTNSQTGVGDAGNFQVSADGSTVVFVAQTIYTDNETADSATTFGPGFAYAIDTSSRVVRRINTTVTPTLGSSLAISANGNYVAVASSITEAMVSSTRGSSLTSYSVNPSGTARFAGINNSGQAYYSVNNQNVLMLDLQARTSQTLKTLATHGGLKMSTDGLSIYLTSTNDLTGENGSGSRQVFKIDTSSLQISQLTNFTTQIPVATGVISADGGKLTYINGGTDIMDVELTPDANTFDFEVGFGNQGGIVAQLSSTLRSIRGLGGLNVASRVMAEGALDRMRENIKGLGTMRGVIGAAQSRIEIATSLTSSQYTSMLDSASRITDADLADETSRVVRQSILQRASASLLAQVNQQPALVLKLLS